MNIIRLEPHSMAIFYKIDADPGFAMKLCSDATLFDAVNRSMFLGEPEPDQREEVQSVVDQLRESGEVSFEDGWISLRIGMAEVTAYLMAQIDEIKAEEHWADKQRFEELKKREEAEGRYELLRRALVDALGVKTAELAEKASAA
ncbi:hypothetical protein [Bradyrhizobium elkanii]|uniref:hypothetical protein n=1 Tax=Bradyrhizobium elkanii TaxID=29448 RepID=UPI000841C3A2|nr:hypothetical protein [Bradyrhizobium elkanii]ODM71698.1 hypothetical protein A6X20_07085 [Bradyrhizobium elkanii]ODM79071.1 hypothetical protein A6452_28670 [Bradyrhizobium elkanii]